MRFRREGKSLNTDTATILYHCDDFDIMKNNVDILFLVEKRDKTRTQNLTTYDFKVSVISEDEARKLVKKNDPDAEFKFFDKKSDYDIRIRLDGKEADILYEIAHINNTNRRAALMEIISKALCDYENQNKKKKK